jgi:hypothetical protein
MAKTLDRYEQEVLAAFEKGSLRSVSSKGELEKFKAVARATAFKDRSESPKTRSTHRR